MTERARSAHEAAWPDMFESLQEAYAQLSKTEMELEHRASEIREARDLFVQVIESMSEALFLLDVSGTVVRANRTAAELLEADQDGLSGEPFSRVCGNPDIPSTPWEISEQRQKGREPTDFDAEVVTRSGARIPALVSCSEVRDEGGGIRGVLVMIRDVTERKAAQDRIREELRQKEALLQELHHRVKNNLQLITSLLGLQARKAESGQVRSALDDSRNRIRALARLHERLYRTEDMESVELGGYVRALARELIGAFGGENVRVDVEVESVQVSLDAAIPCGLIVNELVTNSLEHGFPDGRRGEIRVRVHATPEGAMRVEVSDDGVGLEDDETGSSPAEALGLPLIETLAKQIDAELTTESGGGGTRVHLTVPASAIRNSEPAGGEDRGPR